ncbi:MAG: hypothetical protein GY928_25750 [Colwellia sp.]|nr:hypothetical protein [Colwellia sp.]
MSLPQFRTFIVVNNSGQTLTYNNNGRINVKETALYINPATGKIVYTQLADDDLGFIAASTLADAAEIVGDNEIDNTSNLYMGSQLQLEITHDEGTAADGTFDLYMAGGDATGELPTDATGYAGADANGLTFIGSLVWESNGLDDEVMRSPIFSIGM